MSPRTEITNNSSVQTTTNRILHSKSLASLQIQNLNKGCTMQTLSENNMLFSGHCTCMDQLYH